MSRSRRSFLQAGSAAIVSGVLPSGFSRTAQAGGGERVRVGIIGRTGKGDYGHAVDVAFTKLPNVDIVALADEDENGRAAGQQRTRAKRVYADFREMLAKEKLDVVAICQRWIDQHHEMILAAAEAGCHVYMEKPFCRTLAECDSAVEALKKRTLKLGIAHSSQYSPVLDVVKSLIGNGEIGDVLELRGRGKEDHRGGGEDLWVLGSHIFGLMRSLAGGNATSCTARVTHQGRAVTKADVVAGPEGIGPLAGDNVQARYSFPSGAYGHFGSRRGMAGRPARFAIQVFGSKGIIEVESGYLTKAYLLRDSSWSPGRSGRSWEPVTSAGVGRPEPRTDGTYEGGHIAAIKDLIDSIKQDRPTRCSAEDCRSIIEMISAVFESHRVGGPIALPMATRVNPLTLMA
ncbi:MAG: Gfo/Idh/MocA family oxidoreductase [Acidimicrobiia bacterium]|nr:Gfo/Idh/MocA family oxidoreductase [Acidimicrobiia bacterium]